MTTSGAVTGSVRSWLRLQGLAVFALSVCLFARGGHSWPLLLAVLLLVPDLSPAAYLAGPRVVAARGMTRSVHPDEAPI